MANAQLDFNEEQLDKTSDLYYLYDKLYQGMVKANEVDPPVFPSSDDLLVLDSNGNPVFDSNGEPVINQDKKAEIDKVSSNFSTILMKNSAYLLQTPFSLLWMASVEVGKKLDLPDLYLVEVIL